MASADQSAFESFLTALTTKSPMFPNDMGVVSKVTTDTPFPEAVAKLMKNRVMAMPVVAPDNGEAVAWFGVEELTHMLLKRFTDDELKKHDVTSLHEHRDELKAAKLGELLKELTPITPGSTIQFSEEVKMLEAARLMIKLHQHRIAVLDEKNHVSNILTQSRAVKLLGVLISEMSIKDKTVDELSLAGKKKELLTVKEDSTVREAFQKMDEAKVGGVGVVNEDGKLVGSMSLRDVKNFGSDARFYYLLGQSVGAWLDNVRCVPFSSLPPSFIHSDALTSLSSSPSPPRENQTLRSSEDHSRRPRSYPGHSQG
jgi:CBS domain-containing protein